MILALSDIEVIEKLEITSLEYIIASILLIPPIIIPNLLLRISDSELLELKEVI